jgi:UDP-3-O-[3-hydroxymyristoyl] glucosamine N-acyltransferase
MKNKNYKLGELARLVDGEATGDPDVLLHGLGDIATAGPGEIAFLTRASRSDEIAGTRASAVIVPLSVSATEKPLLKVRDPNLAAAVIHNYFLAAPFVAAGIHERAVIGRDCHIPAAVCIGPLATIGDGVTLGERVTVHAGVVIGNNVTIGPDTIIYPNVSIYANSRIGARVIIHSGAVIGSDGFGYATDGKGRHVKRPHVGIAQIDDDVEIGANSCVDRGTFGKTWVQRGTKIDNLVQLGHNVVIGEDSIIVSQVGIAGSATLGHGVILGGQTGIKGHIHLDDGVMVGSKSGVHGSLPKGAVVSGIPAIPHQEWLKACTLFGKLPQMFQNLREIRKMLAALQKSRSDNEDSR